MHFAFTRNELLLVVRLMVVFSNLRQDRLAQGFSLTHVVVLWFLVNQADSPRKRSRKICHYLVEIKSEL
jgi:hypothetical protein